MSAIATTAPAITCKDSTLAIIQIFKELGVVLFSGVATGHSLVSGRTGSRTGGIALGSKSLQDISERTHIVRDTAGGWWRDASIMDLTEVFNLS